MNNVIEATTDNGFFAASLRVKWTLLLLFAAQDTRCIRARAQEDVALDAYDLLLQAEVVLILGRM